MEGVVVGDGGGEAAIDNYSYRLPNHLHNSYAMVVTSPFQYQDHRLPGRLLREDSVSERSMYQLHDQPPLCLFPLRPLLSPVTRPLLFRRRF